MWNYSINKKIMQIGNDLLESSVDIAARARAVRLKPLFC